MKTIYREIREELGYTRERAEEVLPGISAEKLERIESGKIHIPAPEDIVIMSNGYNKPELKNYYCANVCPVGKAMGIKSIERKNLYQIVIETLAALNNANEQKERLIDIVSDGEIDNEEMIDFIKIKNELEKISETVEGLKLWADEKLDSSNEKTVNI